MVFDHDKLKDVCDGAVGSSSNNNIDDRKRPHDIHDYNQSTSVVSDMAKH